MTLRQAYDGYFPIGAAVSPQGLGRYGDLLTRHFRSLTAENCMKPQPTQPKEGVFAFADGDAIVDFAKENGLLVRGHTLVWHQQTPDWFFEAPTGGPASRDLLLGRMRDHINTVVGHFKGSVYCWDVVNEAVDDSGPHILRRSKWFGMVGEDFLAKAFNFAHEADPNAQLFYNDYNECDAGKRSRIIAMLKGLISQGVPIHGLGLQGHWGPTHPDLDDIRRSIGEYAELDLKLQITELDLSVYRWNDDDASTLTRPTEEMMEAQAERYGRIFEIFREFKDAITGVTFWGVADDGTWLDNFPVRGRKNWPLLFDTEHQPKKAFHRITAI